MAVVVVRVLLLVVVSVIVVSLLHDCPCCCCYSYHSYLPTIREAFPKQQHHHPSSTGRAFSSPTSSLMTSRSTRRANQKFAHGKTILDAATAAAGPAAKGPEKDEPPQQQEEEAPTSSTSTAAAAAVGPLLSSSSDTTTKKTNVVKTKIIYCVRHGQSISNALMERPGHAWGDPNYNDYTGNVRDAPLSAIGQVQAAQALLQLDDADLEEVELVVVSPLTRCLETLLYSNFLNSTTSPSRGQNDTTTTTTTATICPTRPPVIVLPLASERVYSVSETGRSKSTLLAALPPATHDWDWSHVPDDDNNECWWYTGTTTSDDSDDNDDHNDDDINYEEEWRPHGQGQVYAVPGEPMTSFQRRMEKLRHWLVEHRPERCILLVTHWGVIRYLSSLVGENENEPPLELANGQVARLVLTASSTSAAAPAAPAPTGRSHW